MDQSDYQNGYQGAYPPARGFADVANQVSNSVSYGNQWLDKTLRDDYDPAYSNVRAGATVIDPERKSRWGLRKSKKPVAQPPAPQIRHCGCKFCSNCQPQVRDDHMPCSHPAHSGHERIRVDPQFCCGSARPPAPQPTGQTYSQTRAAPFDPGWDSSSQSRQPSQWPGNTYDPGSYSLSTMGNYSGSASPPEPDNSHLYQPHQPRGRNADYYEAQPEYRTPPSQYRQMSSSPQETYGPQNTSYQNYPSSWSGSPPQQAAEEPYCRECNDGTRIMLRHGKCKWGHSMT